MKFLSGFLFCFSLDLLVHYNAPNACIVYLLLSILAFRCGKKTKY
jgi:hypothetical protein